MSQVFETDGPRKAPALPAVVSRLAAAIMRASDRKLLNRARPRVQNIDSSRNVTLRRNGKSSAERVTAPPRTVRTSGICPWLRQSL